MRTGMRLSRIAGRLVGTCGMLVAAACGGGHDGGGGATQPPPPPPPPPRQQLTVVTDSGAVLTPVLATGTYAKDTTIAYTVTLRPGYTDPVVVIDSAVAQLSGTITMDRPHLFVASARRVPVTLPATDPVEQRFGAVLASSEPDLAYQQYLDAVADLSTRASADSVQRHVEAVEDWVLASDGRVAAFRRADSLLAGKVFEWRVPAVSASRSPEPRQERRSVAPEAAAGPRSAVIFVNGILNTFAAAATSSRALQLLAQERVPALATGRTRWLQVYSPSVIVPFLGRNACERKLVANLLRRPGLLYALIALPRPVARLRVEHELGCSFDSDVIEALIQIFNPAHLSGEVVAVSHGASLELKETIEELRRDDRVVTVVAHSQGNLMAGEALGALAPLNDGPGLCVSYLGVAAPGPQHVGSAAPAEAITVKGAYAADLMLILLPDNGAEKVSTDLVGRYDQREATLSALLPLTGAAVPALVHVVDGLFLHNFLGSYLDPQDGAVSRAWIGTRLGGQVRALEEACRGRVRVHVRDATTRAALAGATLTVQQNAQPDASAASGADGTALSPAVLLRPSAARVTAPGYDTVWVSGIEPMPQGTRDLGTVSLTPLGARTGTLRVTVADDATGETLAGAAVVVKRGDQVAAQAATGATGSVAVTLKAGFYTVTATLGGYRASDPAPVTVPQDGSVSLLVRLVSTSTAPFGGTWTYSQQCSSELGFVNAEAHYTQVGAHVTGDVRILQSAQGGGWARIEGVVEGRTMSGNSTEWIEENPNWTLNHDWQQTLSADNNQIVGSPPIDACPDVPWTRVGPAPDRAPAPAARLLDRAYVPDAARAPAPANGGAAMSVRPPQPPTAPR